MPHPQRQIVCDKGRLFSRFGERDQCNIKSSNQAAQGRGLGSGDWGDCGQLEQMLPRDMDSDRALALIRANGRGWGERR